MLPLYVDKTTDETELIKLKIHTSGARYSDQSVSVTELANNSKLPA